MLFRTLPFLALALFGPRVCAQEDRETESDVPTLPTVSVEAPAVYPPSELGRVSIRIAPESATLFEANAQMLFQQRTRSGWSVEGVSDGQLRVDYQGIALNNPWSPHREFSTFSLSPFLFGLSAAAGDDPFAAGPRLALGEPPPNGGLRGEYFATVGTGDLLAAGLRYRDDRTFFAIGARDDWRLSQADRGEAGNTEADESLGVNLHGRYRSDFLGLTLAAVYLDERQMLDFGGGPGGDDPNYDGRDQTFVMLTEAKRSKFAYRLITSEARNRPDAVHAQDLETRFTSHALLLDTPVAALAGGQSYLVESHLAGQAEVGDAREAIDGARDESKGKSVSSLQPGLSAAWEEPTHKFLSGIAWVIDNHGTATRAYADPKIQLSFRRRWAGDAHESEWIAQRDLRTPGLYELHGAYGSADLAPERSWAVKWLESFRLGSLRFTAGTFYRELTSRIDFDLTSSRYVNRSRAQLWGGSLKAEMPIGPLQIAAALNGLYSRDENGAAWLRRAPWNADLQATVPLLGGRWEIVERAVGARPDVDPQTFARRRLPAFATTTLTYVRELRRLLPQPCELVLQVENLFDHRYQSIAGYESLRRHASIGLRSGI